MDDGKSTLLGRLFRDSKGVLDDRDGAADSAPPADGARPERERGFAGGVAYRYFETDKRKFAALDVPGHSRYTPNLAEGASVADLALILVDARKGVLTQTRRHSYIVSLMGIRQAVLAVNKMDLVEYGRQAFSSIVRGIRAIRPRAGDRTGERGSGVRADRRKPFRL